MCMWMVLRLLLFEKFGGMAMCECKREMTKFSTRSFYTMCQIRKYALLFNAHQSVLENGPGHDRDLFLLNRALLKRH